MPHTSEEHANVDIDCPAGFRMHSPCQPVRLIANSKSLPYDRVEDDDIRFVLGVS